MSIGWGLGPDHTCRSTGLSSFLLRWAAWCSTMGTHRIQFERTVSYGVPGQGQSCGDGLSAKADEALASQGLAGPSVGGKQADKFFRDLGVLAYLDATGRPSDAGGARPDHDRVAGL